VENEQNRRNDMATTNTKTANARGAKASKTRKIAVFPIFRETYYVGLGFFDWTAEHLWSFEKELAVRGEKRHTIIAKKTKELRQQVSKRVKELPDTLSERTEILKAGLDKRAREIKAGARKRVKQLRESVQETAAAAA
jgi:hypothetical protein